MKKSPRIGITMRLETPTRRFYLGRDYSEALTHLDAVPVHISLIPDEQYIENVLSSLDGVLLPGSDSDVDPIIFGEEPHPKLKSVVPEKDSTDLLVLNACEALKVPILAICFGMQVLNVSRGGTLIQDIDSQTDNSIKHDQGIPLDRNSHRIDVKEESIISRLITKELVSVNSHHHQAVRKVGENLEATAWAKDGIIECIEDTRKDRFTLGVQWHPELSWRNDSLSAGIFREFEQAAREFANHREGK